MSMFTPVFIPVSARVTEYGGGARAVAARKGGNKNIESSKNVGDKDNADAKKGASKFSLKTFKSTKDVGDKENAGNGADAKKGGSKFSLKTFKSSKNAGDKENAGSGADAKKGGSTFSFKSFKSSKNVGDNNTGEKAAAKSNDSKAVSAFAIPRALRSLAKRTTSKTGEKTATPIASPGDVEVQSGEKTATSIASPAQEALDAGEKDVNDDKEDDVALPRVKVPLSRGLAEMLKSMMGHIALAMVGAGAATNGGGSPATFDMASTESATPHMPGWLSTHASITAPTLDPASTSGNLAEAPSYYSHASIHDANAMPVHDANAMPVHHADAMPACFSTQTPSYYAVSYADSLEELLQAIQATVDESRAGIDEFAERRREYDLQTSESILELRNNLGDRCKLLAQDESAEEVAERRRQYDLQTSESILELRNNLGDRNKWLAEDEPTAPSPLLDDAASCDAVPACGSFQTAADSASFKTVTESVSLRAATDFGSQCSVVSYATLPPLDAPSSSSWSFVDSAPTTPDLPGHIDFFERDDSPVVTQKDDITSSISTVWHAQLAELWLAADGLRTL